MAAHSRAPQPSVEFQEHTDRLNTLLSTRTLGRGIVAYHSSFSLFHPTATSLSFFTMYSSELYVILLVNIRDRARGEVKLGRKTQKNSDMLGFSGSYPGPDTGNLSATAKSCENRLEFLKSAPSTKLAVTSGNCIWGEENKR